MKLSQPHLEVTDYPRLFAPGTEPTVEHARNDEEAQPKERHHGAHENERCLREDLGR
jgi:hypothetical protein